MNMLKSIFKTVTVFISLSMMPGIAVTARAAFQTVHNDFFWYDTSGNSIQTRSGCIRKFNNLYYWYGMQNGSNQNCYTSADLIHWVYKGIVLTTPGISCDRMDVLYCDSTKQYVMFLKYDTDIAYLGIATCATPDGQFVFKGSSLVQGAKIGDMSMYEDDDKKAYLAYVWDSAGTNAQHAVALMSGDYLTVEKRIYLWNRGGREAPHIFKRHGVYYYGTSQTDWVASTATEYYTATNLAGPWSSPTTLSTPGSTDSWETQCDFVFPFYGPNDTVYMYDGDRWTKTPWAQGDYPWLPLTFNGTVPTMNYYEDWDIDINAGTWRPFDLSRNLALHKTATASSVSGANAASNVTDSAFYLTYINYRWESAASDPQWIMVDLGAPTNINRVILKWHSDYAKAFQIQTSTNSTTWTDVYSTTKGGSWSVTDVAFNTASARYVRMYGTQRGTANGYSLFNFMVLNDSLSTPTTFKAEKSPVPVASKTILNCQNNAIHYFIAKNGSVKLEMFDAMGKIKAVLVDGFQNRGNHGASLPGKLGKGIYVLRLTLDGETHVIYYGVP